MEALEKRVKICTDEKRHLEKKVSALEKQNSSLLGQLKKLQKLVTEGTRQTARTGTCAMVRIYILTHFLSNLMRNLRIDIYLFYLGALTSSNTCAFLDEYNMSVSFPCAVSKLL